MVKQQLTIKDKMSVWCEGVVCGSDGSKHEHDQKNWYCTVSYSSLQHADTYSSVTVGIGDHCCTWNMVC